MLRKTRALGKEVVRVLLFTIILSAFVLTYTAYADESTVKPHDEMEAIRKGLAYVESQSLTWMRQRKCASCHHVPMMVSCLAVASTGTIRRSSKPATFSERPNSLTAPGS